MALVALVWSFQAHGAKAFKVGRRRIQCSVPKGGTERDCLMDPRPNLPGVLAFVGAQATLPALGKCPIENQIQPPWFTGGAGAGLCPPEFWSAGTVLPGIAILATALALNAYISSNRLLITERAIGIAPSSAAAEEIAQSLTPLAEVDEWFVTPLGLVLKLDSGTYRAFPLAWDQKSVEAVLEDRL